MTRFIRQILPAIFAVLALVSAAGCTSSPSASTTAAPANIGASSTAGGAAPTTATVTRGDISVTVMVNGNLVMPQAFDLHFGAPGNVKDIFVEEGDFVKAGTVMATLDSSSLQLDIKAANIDLQKAISELYLTIPSIQTTMAYPSFYPNASASVASRWAIEEVKEAQVLLEENKPQESVAKLQIAIADLEACAKIFEDAISNPESGLGSATLEEVEKQVMIEGKLHEKYDLVRKWQDLIDDMKQAQRDLAAASKSIIDKKYASSYFLFYDLVQEVDSLNVFVKDNVNRVQVRRVNARYPEETLSLYFYDIAEEKLDSALKSVQNGGLNSAQYFGNLQIAEHNMSLCNAILNSSMLVLENGLVQRQYELFNIEISKKHVALENARENLLKSVIIAPFDGMVVSVGMKNNDILSQVDYSSKGTIQLVDTTAIKFQGQVDEIDTLKINMGQEAIISVDAVSDTKFKGKVRFISPYGIKVGNVIKFPITIELEPYNVELRGGLSASADIAISSAKNILKIPLTAITNTPQGAFASLVGAPGVPPEKRQIKLGIQDNQFAEVVSGLKEGDKIAIGEKLSGNSPVITRPVPPPPSR